MKRENDNDIKSPLKEEKEENSFSREHEQSYFEANSNRYCSYALQLKKLSDAEFLLGHSSPELHDVPHVNDPRRKKLYQDHLEQAELRDSRLCKKLCDDYHDDYLNPVTGNFYERLLREIDVPITKTAPYSYQQLKPRCFPGTRDPRRFKLCESADYPTSSIVPSLVDNALVPVEQFQPAILNVDFTDWPNSVYSSIDPVELEYVSFSSTSQNETLLKDLSLNSDEDIQQESLIEDDLKIEYSSTPVETSMHGWRERDSDDDVKNEILFAETQKKKQKVKPSDFNNRKFAAKTNNNKSIVNNKIIDVVDLCDSDEETKEIIIPKRQIISDNIKKEFEQKSIKQEHCTKKIASTESVSIITIDDDDDEDENFMSDVIVNLQLQDKKNSDATKFSCSTNVLSRYTDTRSLTFDNVSRSRSEDNSNDSGIFLMPTNDATNTLLPDPTVSALKNFAESKQINEDKRRFPLNDDLYKKTQTVSDKNFKSTENTKCCDKKIVKTKSLNKHNNKVNDFHDFINTDSFQMTTKINATLVTAQNDEDINCDQVILKKVQNVDTHFSSLCSIGVSSDNYNNERQFDCAESPVVVNELNKTEMENYIDDLADGLINDLIEKESENEKRFENLQLVSIQNSQKCMGQKQAGIFQWLSEQSDQEFDLDTDENLSTINNSNIDGNKNMIVPSKMHIDENINFNDNRQVSLLSSKINEDTNKQSLVSFSTKLAHQQLIHSGNQQLFFKQLFQYAQNFIYIRSSLDMLIRHHPCVSILKYIEIHERIRSENFWRNRNNQLMITAEGNNSMSIPIEEDNKQLDVTDFIKNPATLKAKNNQYQDWISLETNMQKSDSNDKMKCHDANKERLKKIANRNKEKRPQDFKISQFDPPEEAGLDKNLENQPICNKKSDKMKCNDANEQRLKKIVDRSKEKPTQDLKISHIDTRNVPELDTNLENQPVIYKKYDLTNNLGNSLKQIVKKKPSSSNILKKSDENSLNKRLKLSPDIKEDECPNLRVYNNIYSPEINKKDWYDDNDENRIRSVNYGSDRFATYSDDEENPSLVIDLKKPSEKLNKISDAPDNSINENAFNNTPISLKWMGPKRASILQLVSNKTSCNSTLIENSNDEISVIKENLSTVDSIKKESDKNISKLDSSPNQDKNDKKLINGQTVHLTKYPLVTDDTAKEIKKSKNISKVKESVTLKSTNNNNKNNKNDQRPADKDFNNEKNLRTDNSASKEIEKKILKTDSSSKQFANNSNKDQLNSSGSTKKKSDRNISKLDSSSNQDKNDKKLVDNRFDGQTAHSNKYLLATDDTAKETKKSKNILKVKESITLKSTNNKNENKKNDKLPADKNFNASFNSKKNLRTDKDNSTSKEIEKKILKIDSSSKQLAINSDKNQLITSGSTKQKSDRNISKLDSSSNQIKKPKVEESVTLKSTNNNKSNKNDQRPADKDFNNEKNLRTDNSTSKKFEKKILETDSSSKQFANNSDKDQLITSSSTKKESRKNISKDEESVTLKSTNNNKENKKNDQRPANKDLNASFNNEKNICTDNSISKEIEKKILEIDSSSKQLVVNSDKIQLITSSSIKQNEKSENSSKVDESVVIKSTNTNHENIKIDEKLSTDKNSNASLNNTKNKCTNDLNKNIISNNSDNTDQNNLNIINCNKFSEDNNNNNGEKKSDHGNEDNENSAMESTLLIKKNNTEHIKSTEPKIIDKHVILPVPSKQTKSSDSTSNAGKIKKKIEPLKLQIIKKNIIKTAVINSTCKCLITPDQYRNSLTVENSKESTKKRKKTSNKIGEKKNIKKSKRDKPRKKSSKKINSLEELESLKFVLEKNGKTEQYSIKRKSSSSDKESIEKDEPNLKKFCLKSSNKTTVLSTLSKNLNNEEKKSMENNNIHQTIEDKRPNVDINSTSQQLEKLTNLITSQRDSNENQIILESREDYSDINNLESGDFDFIMNEFGIFNDSLQIQPVCANNDQSVKPTLINHNPVFNVSQSLINDNVTATAQAASKEISNHLERTEINKQISEETKFVRKPVDVNTLQSIADSTTEINNVQEKKLPVEKLSLTEELKKFNIQMIDIDEMQSPIEPNFNVMLNVPNIPFTGNFTTITTVNVSEPTLPLQFIVQPLPIIYQPVQLFGTSQYIGGPNITIPDKTSLETSNFKKASDLYPNMFDNQTNNQATIDIQQEKEPDPSLIYNLDFFGKFENLFIPEPYRVKRQDSNALVKSKIRDYLTSVFNEILRVVTFFKRNENIVDELVNDFNIYKELKEIHWELQKNIKAFQQCINQIIEMIKDKNQRESLLTIFQNTLKETKYEFLHIPQRIESITVINAIYKFLTLKNIMLPVGNLYPPYLEDLNKEIISKQSKNFNFSMNKTEKTTLDNHISSYKKILKRNNKS